MPKSSTRKNGNGRSTLVFRKQNYVLLAVSLILIAVGFVAMYLDGQFLGFVSLTVSPLIILSGYAMLVYAILARPDEASQPAESA